MAIKISEVSAVGYRQGYATGFAEEDLQVAFCAEAWVRSKGSSSPGGSEPADCSCRTAGRDGDREPLHRAQGGQGSPGISGDGQTQHQTANPCLVCCVLKRPVAPAKEQTRRDKKIWFLLLCVISPDFSTSVWIKFQKF